jgi:hypothetical protein
MVSKPLRVMIGRSEESWPVTLDKWPDNWCRNTDETGVYFDAGPNDYIN